MGAKTRRTLPVIHTDLGTSDFCRYLYCRELSYAVFSLWSLYRNYTGNPSRIS
jgi:hypothetical protein